MKGIVLILLLAALCGCQGTSTAPEGAAPTVESKTFVIAALMAAHPEPEPSEGEVREASSGHFENMKRLKDAGKLLLAGPSGSTDSEFRGLFILNCETLEEARELTASDPAIKAGLLRAEVTTMQTEAPLDQLPRLVEEATARRLLVSPNDPAEGFVGRPYVIATCNRGAQAERGLAKMIRAGRVLFHGDLGEPAPPGTSMFVLDVDSVALAEVELANSGVLEGLGASWALDLWWASEAVAALPEAATR